ncbi:hypothetical protein CLOM_g2476 [Closterium sp. NIES-68]|nr:hypothetical protein CLOM_g2476 [Closterium sp. NIES-68]GJP74332.1 hypothetical protein CLOP_g4929 [Closterium sp. NIES-67]
MRHALTIALLLILGAFLLAAQPSDASLESAWRRNRAWRNGGRIDPLQAPAAARGIAGKSQAADAAGSAVYIVRLSTAPPLSEYRGGIAGYPATATWDDGSDEEENDDDRVPEMLLSADASGVTGGESDSEPESVDLDDTNVDHPFPNATAPSPAPADEAPGGSATASARGGASGSGSGGCPRHRLRLSMDRPQVAAFASLLQRQQAQVASEAGVGDGDLLYSYKHTSNGFAARLTARQAWRLQRNPAVASVRRSRVFQRQTSDSPKFLGLPGKVWPAVGGQSKAGDGTVVGIIDTGIWPEHPSFSDKGFSSNLPSGWKGKCEQSSTFRCNNKLIGAKAFYGGFQRASGKPALTNDWLTPRDADGHGTWCAGAAAGNPVGLQGGGQVSGMAPAARIAAYKVFWTDRSSGNMYADESDIIAAVNQGVSDGVDVLSLSLGGLDPNDNYFNDLAFMRANAAGVFVAFAAGNAGAPGRSQGAGYRTVGNFAPFFLTVGASTIARGASLASAAAAAGTQSLPLSAIAGAGSTNNTVSCNGTGRGNSTGNGTLPGDGSAMPGSNFSSADGSSLTFTADGGITFTTSSSAAPVVADFSSRGPLLPPSATAQAPQPGNAILKPDIIGPGVDLLAAAPGKKIGETGGLARLSGTSMATPHLAGLAALIIQKYPNWSPAQVMSAMMTTARVTDTASSPIKSSTGGEATPWEMGAGHVFPPAMLDPGLTYDARDKDYQNFLAGQDLTRAKREFPGVSLSPLAVRNLNLPTITLPRLQGSIQVTRTVTNVGGSQSTYSVSGNAPAGVKVTVAPKSLTVDAGQKASYTMTFTVDTPSNDFKYGYIVWADNQGHSVRSPLVVQPLSR